MVEWFDEPPNEPMVVFEASWRLTIADGEDCSGGRATFAAAESAVRIWSDGFTSSSLTTIERFVGAAGPLTL